jgi:hypothetical protein
MLLTSVTIVGVLFFAGATVSLAATLTFEADTINEVTPFTDTVGELSVTFGGAASVCDSAGIFSSLSGNVLIQELCGPDSETGPLSISFSSDISHLTFNFATSGGLDTLYLTAFENSTPVAAASFMSSFPTDGLNGEASVTFDGMFNSVTLTSASILAIDNLNATVASTVPDPPTFAMMFAGFGFFIFLARRWNWMTAHGCGITLVPIRK